MGIFELILVVIVILWLGGVAINVGPFIHLLLVLLALVITYRVLRGERI